MPPPVRPNQPVSAPQKGSPRPHGGGQQPPPEDSPEVQIPERPPVAPREDSYPRSQESHGDRLFSQIAANLLGDFVTMLTTNFGLSNEKIKQLVSEQLDAQGDQ